MARRPQEPTGPPGRARRRRGTRAQGELRVLWGLLRLGAGGDDSLHFGVLWGLVRIRQAWSGVWDLDLLWGLLRLRTPPSEPLVLGSKRERARQRREVLEPRPEPDAEPEVEAVPLDPYQQAEERTERQLGAVRLACIVAGVGIGFGALGAWPLTALLVAVAGAILLANFAERLRPNFLEREVQQARIQTETRRVTAGEHARELEKLSASIAHEIRNPITAAKSLVQQMGEDPRAGENVEYARVALGELERVERSVSHLLRFAREEKVEVQEFSLAEIAESALAALRDRTEKHQVAVQTEIDTQGRMSGDPEKLRRVVLNLVGNAVDALSESGIPSPCVWVEIGDNLAGTEVWLRVRDNGPGISRDDQARIFSPFYTSREKGTGLGLAITKKLVEAHGGSIELKSEPGAGADFLLTFPKGFRSSG